MKTFILNSHLLLLRVTTPLVSLCLIACSGGGGGGGEGGGGGAAAPSLDQKLVLSTPSGTLTISEGSSSNVILLLDRQAPLDVDLHWSINDTVGDFAVDSGDLRFSTNENSKIFSLNSTQNTKYDKTRSYVLTISGSPSFFAGQVQVNIDLTDDEVMPELTMASSAASVAEGQSVNIIFALNRISVDPVTFDWAASGGSATAGTDFSPATGSVTIAAGSTSATVSLSAAADIPVEGDETFSFQISQLTGATDGTTSIPLTILDAGSAPRLNIAAASVSEGSAAGTTSLTFTVTSTAVSASPITVDYATSAGTATGGGTDYSNASGTVTIAAGDTTATIPVSINRDALYESNETLTLTLSGGSGYEASGSTLVATGTITDDDTQPDLTISDVSVSEGTGAGTTNATFTVSLDTVSGVATKVDYATAANTATAGGVDFTTTSGTLTVPAGSSTGVINVPINRDAVFELDETLYVNLSNPVNATSSDIQAVATIVNDDIAPTLAIADASLSEGTAAGTSNLTFTVTLSAVSAVNTIVNYATSTGTAIASDYTATSGTLTILAGASSGTIPVVINRDLLYEADETFTLTLSNGSGYEPTGSTLIATGTITDDDLSPDLTISDVSVTEGTGAGTTTATFTVTLDSVSSLASQIDYTTTDNTATGGTDFTSTSGTLTIPAGSSTGTIAVPITRDEAYELDVTFYLDLSNPVNLTVSDSRGVGTILNDDNAPTLSVANASVAEGTAAGTTALTFTVTLSALSPTDTTVNYATSTGSADATDYTDVSGTLTITAGTSTGTIPVTVARDASDESNETLTLTLSGGAGYTASGSILSATGTITNDDSAGASLTVTVNQNASQADPSGLPVAFDVAFSAAIDPATFTSADITQSGTATGVTWSVVDSGNHQTFTLSATAVTTDGTLIPSLAQGVVTGAGGESNDASTSTDNTVTVDTTGPSSPTLSVNGAANYATTLTVPLTLSAVGAAEMYITDAAGCASGGSWVAYSTSANWTLPAANAQNTVYVKYRDVAHNESTCVSDSVIHDTIAPTAPTSLSLGPVAEDLSVTPVLTWTAATDSGSGIAFYQIRIARVSDSASTTWSNFSSGNYGADATLLSGTAYKIEVRATDAAGNVGVVADSPSWTTASPGLCPVGFVQVPPVAGVTDNTEFCVSKFEARQLAASTSVSKISGTPYVSRTRTQASNNCINSGYTLMTNAQWQAVARDIESVSWNWSGGVIGSAGGISRTMGASEALTAGYDTESCLGTGATCDLSTWNEKRRVHKLSNGKYIWDFAGNVAEWVSDVNGTTYSSAAISQITAAPKTMFGPIGSYSSLNSSPYGGLGEIIGGSGNGIIRSGSWATGSLSIPTAGIFTADIKANTTSLTTVGFRCAYDLANLTFPAVTDMDMSQPVISNSVRFQHASGGTRAIAVSGDGNPTLIINGVKTGSSSGNVNSGDLVAIRMTSAATPTTAATATITAGGSVSGTFQVTTGAAVTTGYLVMTEATYTGNMTSRTNANGLCLTELNSKTWRNKSSATLNSTTVKAFLCDSSGCNNLTNATKYRFARAGDADYGGYVLTTTSSTNNGPGNALNWADNVRFGIAASYWTGRAAGSTNTWGASVSNDEEAHCENWSSTSTGSGRTGTIGYSDSTNTARWSGGGTCSSSNRLICMVNP